MFYRWLWTVIFWKKLLECRQVNNYCIGKQLIMNSKNIYSKRSDGKWYLNDLFLIFWLFLNLWFVYWIIYYVYFSYIIRTNFRFAAGNRIVSLFSLTCCPLMKLAWFGNFEKNAAEIWKIFFIRENPQNDIGKLFLILFV